MDCMILALLFFILPVAVLLMICTLILGLVGLLKESARFLTTFWLMFAVASGLCCSKRGVVNDSQPEL